MLRCGPYLIARLLVHVNSHASTMMELVNIVLLFSEASKSTWCSKVYDHYNITLRCELDDHQKPKKLVFVFTCNVDPTHHTLHVRPRMSIGHGTKNLQEGCKGVIGGAYNLIQENTTNVYFVSTRYIIRLGEAR